MGIFDKIKQNFSHGGVSLQIVAPQSVTMQDAVIPVNVIVTANDNQQTIKRVTVKLCRRNVSHLSDNSDDMAPEDLGYFNYTEPFTLAINESQEVQVQVPLNAGSMIAQSLPQDGIAAGILGALQKVDSFAQSVSTHPYEYWLDATADVEGIAIDPSTTFVIEMQRPSDLPANPMPLL